MKEEPIADQLGYDPPDRGKGAKYVLGFNLAAVRALLDGPKQLSTPSSGQHPSRELLANMASADSCLCALGERLLQWDQCGAGKQLARKMAAQNQ